MKKLLRFLWLTVALGLAGCATTTVQRPESLPTRTALPPAVQGPLARAEAQLHQRTGADSSGFELLDRNEDGLRWRIALIDSARQSIDAQYYLWYGDSAGLLLLKHVLDAADRGVKVRLLVDDLNTMLKTAGEVRIGDTTYALIASHPNIELRLFNPWTKRELLARAGEAVSDMERLNQRMHNKAFIVDNRAAILGGRNIGDEYLGLHDKFNFRDLDVLGVGPVARQASEVFDAFWNSRWVLPASLLKPPPLEGRMDEARQALAQTLRGKRAIEAFPLDTQDWGKELDALVPRLRPGRSEVHSDLPDGDRMRHHMLKHIYALSETARREIRIINAYLIPDDEALQRLAALKARGVDTRILTNSLASHDVPAVNSHYKSTRRQLCESITGLYETRHDAAIQSQVADTPPTQAGFMGLHAKGMAVDRERVFVGSMNFDPRSSALNSEMGAFIESPALAQDLAALIERDMLPANSWRVKVDDKGALTWTNDRETVRSQPARNWWQRVEDVLFMAAPASLY